ncbi:MAG: hypothetical protein QOF11_2243 [Chloroflexota bacterium]|nr:hypothetical protein [Chloroflexota bacterium]
MSRQLRARLSLRPLGRPWRLALVGFSLMLAACSPAGDATATPSQPQLGLSASASGVCAAILALPDRVAAERAFVNVAHQALHGLAADPRLDRTRSARVLEAMQKVEADFSRPADATELTADLTELRSSTDAALQAIGVEVPACAQ